MFRYFRIRNQHRLFFRSRDPRHLVRQLERWGYGMIDCQMATAHLARFGAREIPRREFMRKLSILVNYPDTARDWRFENDLFD